MKNQKENVKQNSEAIRRGKKLEVLAVSSLEEGLCKAAVPEGAEGFFECCKLASTTTGHWNKPLLSGQRRVVSVIWKRKVKQQQKTKTGTGCK